MSTEIKWLDENHIDGEMGQAEFEAAVMRDMAERVKKETAEGKPRNYGNDGITVVFRSDDEAYGIPYSLIVCRYWAVLRNPDGTFTLRPEDELKWNRINKHVCLESECRPSYGLRDFLGWDDLLWRDSNHLFQKDWNLQQQWDWCEQRAMEDINNLMFIEEAFNTRVAELSSAVAAIKAKFTKLP
jgi:hypothetical protein